jgi:hypothetical protein
MQNLLQDSVGCAVSSTSHAQLGLTVLQPVLGRLDARDSGKSLSHDIFITRHVCRHVCYEYPNRKNESDTYTQQSTQGLSLLLSLLFTFSAPKLLLLVSGINHHSSFIMVACRRLALEAGPKIPQGWSY